MEEKGKIFIPGNVPSSKNSKQWTGKMLINSKAVRKYIFNTKSYYENFKKEFKELTKDMEKPYPIYFEFIRGSRHRFDYINPAQTVQDLMVKHDWIEDDNMDNLLPYFLPYSYDKENPGVNIIIKK